MKISTFVFSLLTLGLAACGPGSENSTNSKEFETRQALLETYSPLVGVYRGTVQPDADEAFPVELKLSIVDERAGVNENGEVIYRPALIGTYVRKDIDPDLVPNLRRPLSVRYYKETNELAMQNSDTPTGVNSGVHVVHVTARLVGRRILGRLSNGYGPVGALDLVR